MAKANGADEIIDLVVPRAAIPAYLAKVSELAQSSGSWVAGCGHAGDGNVHLSVFQPDVATRDRLLLELFGAGLDLGGAISGEHGIGTGQEAPVRGPRGSDQAGPHGSHQGGVRPQRHPQPRQDPLILPTARSLT